MTLTWDELPGLFPALPDPDRWLPLLQCHAALLEAAAARVRVTAVAPGDAVRRQYAESLELLTIVEAHAPSPTALADIGSGGGFPGLVIAIVRPGMRLHLVEPLQKRARLLAELVEALGLSNVTVHAARAEDAGRGPLRDSLPVVTARAVAELRELLEYTAPLAAPGGLIALPKGSAFAAELLAAAGSMAALACEFEALVAMRPEVSETLSVALFRTSGPTAAAYPRRPGVPAKRPL